MIQRKKKICKGTGKYEGLGCGKEKYIFSHGLCADCVPKRPIKKTAIKQSYKPVIQDGVILSQKKAFERAYSHYNGLCYINSVPLIKELTRHWNYLHVLPKKQYPLFKFYWKNIVLGTKPQHDLYDQGTWDKIISERVRTGLDPLLGWERLYQFRAELLEEYEEWIRTNKGRYKL